MNESILHFGGVRLRVTGTGTLIMSLKNLDDSETVLPASVDMGNLVNQEPFSLVSMVTQRAKLRIETETKDDQFEISRIILYTKPIWESWPG